MPVVSNDDFVLQLQNLYITSYKRKARSVWLTIKPSLGRPD